MKETAECDRLGRRLTVLLQARCRKSSWKVFDVELENISTGGCCVIGNASRFEPMQPLSLRFANYRNVDAKVRWVAGEKAGLEFQAPLKRSAVETLARTYGIAMDRTSSPDWPAPTSPLRPEGQDPALPPS